MRKQKKVSNNCHREWQIFSLQNNFLKIVLKKCFQINVISLKVLELHKNLGLRTSANGILGDGETCYIGEGIKIECHNIENVRKQKHINNIEWQNSGNIVVSQKSDSLVAFLFGTEFARHISAKCPFKNFQPLFLRFLGEFGEI
jgi:hypothetical protein